MRKFEVKVILPQCNFIIVRRAIYAFALAIGIFAVALTFSLPTINVSPPRVAYNEAQTMVWVLIASNPSNTPMSDLPGRIVLSSADVPGYKNLFSKTIVVAKDVSCKTPIPYWIETKNSSYLRLWFKIDTLPQYASTTFYICAVKSYTSGTFSDPEKNGLFPYFTGFETSTSLETTYLGMVGYSTNLSYKFTRGGLLVYNDMSPGYEAEIILFSTRFTTPAPYYFIIYRVSLPQSSLGYFGAFMYASTTSVIEYALNLQIIYTSTTQLLYGVYYLMQDFGGIIGTIALASTQTTLETGAIVNSFYKPFFYTVAGAGTFALGNFDDTYGMLGTYILTNVYFTSDTFGIIVGRLNDGVSSIVNEQFFIDWVLILPYYGYYPDIYLGGVIYTVTFK